MMKVAVLIDNNPHPELNLLTEHGLSIFFEADGFKWLMDVGASEHFYTNAVSMGINIEDVDFLVLSHGHSDHTGGLAKFIEVNQKAQIIMSAQIEGKTFFSYRLQSKRNIGINYSIVTQNINRFIFVNGNMRISKNVGLVSEIPIIFETPKANRRLYMLNSKGEQLDEFKHEVVLAVNTTKGVVVFSGCSHNGILNILDACSNYFNKSEIIACIGGTHLIDSDSNNTYESESEINALGKSIISHYPNMQLITGHCTGTNAHKQLSIILGDNYKSFYSGNFLSALG
jgi:7,8-dihydropterin-6-yl-methyl-4-(beta-D-ribofuranosyl)aminobenzene 5'-phosphate synthase